MNFKRRVGLLEKELRVNADIQRLRIVMVMLTDGDEPTGLRECERRFHKGYLSEKVVIIGSRDGISEADLERFIERSPILGPDGREVTLPRRCVIRDEFAEKRPTMKRSLQPLQER